MQQNANEGEVEVKTEKQNVVISGVEWFLFLGFLAMVLMVFANVMGRFFLNMGIAESEEISRILFVWISFVGAALCFWDDSHVKVDILINVLPPLPKKIVAIIANILISVILFILIRACIDFMVVNWKDVLHLTKLPLRYVQSILPISLALMFVMNIIKLVQYVKDLVKGAKD